VKVVERKDRGNVNKITLGHVNILKMSCPKQ